MSVALEVNYETVKLVQDSWDDVLKIPDCTQVAGELLFRNIFEIAPGAWKMFHFGKNYESADDEMFQSADFRKHAKNVVSMLDTAVHFLGPDLQCLEDALVDLGARHVGYGVLPEHYPIVGQALLETLAAALGDAFDSALREAWTGVYGFVTTNMLKGANESLLRVSLPVLDQDETMTLDECVTSMLPGQKELYYATYNAATTLPQVQRLQKAGAFILRISKDKKDTMVVNLSKYLGRNLVDVAEDELDLSFLDPPKVEEEKSSPRSVTRVFSPQKDGGLDFHEANDFCAWFLTELGPGRVIKCTPTCKFASQPARVIHAGEDVQTHIRQLGDFDCMPLPKKHVEINPSHELILEINKARTINPKIARMLAEQVHDNCLINAGLMEDCRGMVNRINDISMCLLKLANSSSSTEATQQ